MAPVAASNALRGKITIRYPSSFRRSRPPRDTSDRGGREPRMADGRGPRIDLHSHAGRCFLAGLPAGHSLVAALGAPAVADAVRSAQAAGMTALVLAAVADF